MERSTITIREHGFLTTRETGDSKEGRRISERAFENLLKYVLDENGGWSEALVPSWKKGYWKILRAKNHVWVIQTADGTTVEILPKVHRTESDAESRGVFLKMLRTLRDSPFKSVGEASIRNMKFPIMEIFISMFLEELGILVRRGVKKAYVPVSENSLFLKGKLKAAENMKRNAVHSERFFVEHDEFTEDNPENRLIKTVLGRLSKASGNEVNKRAIREFLFIFSDVAESLDIMTDLSTSKTVGRLHSHYEKTLVWTRVFLSGESLVSFAGSTIALSLLFPMEKLFESYVARKLVRSGLFQSLKTQDSSYSLVADHGGKKKFFLRPDIVAYRESEIPVIIDTKWKTVDESNSKDNYGISQADMYQLYAYARKYHSKELYLVFPKTDTFRTSLLPFVYHPDKGIVLKAVWYDVMTDEMDGITDV